MNQTVQDVLVFTKRDTTAEPVHECLRAGTVRRSEWVVLGFLVYAVALGALLPVAPFVRHLVTLLNVAILAVYAVLILFDRTKPALAFRATRDAVSLALIVLAYRNHV